MQAGECGRKSLHYCSSKSPSFLGFCDLLNSSRFAGTTQSIAADIGRVEKIISQDGGSAFEFARTEAEMHNLWSARKEAVWAMSAQRPEGTQLWSTDVAVPLSRLPEIIGKLHDGFLLPLHSKITSRADLSKKESQSLGLFSSVLGHVGDGNFHQAVIYDPNNPSQTQAVQECVKRMVHRAVEMEGTVSVCSLPHGTVLTVQ